jgi:hypothetical protein
VAERVRESPGDLVIILTYDPPRRRRLRKGTTDVDHSAQDGRGDTGAKARLPMLAPPLAALLYPFAFKRFNASVTRIPEGGAGAFALSWLSAAVYLALAFAVPLIAPR